MNKGMNERNEGDRGHNRKLDIRRSLDLPFRGLKEKARSAVTRLTEWYDNASRKKVATIIGVSIAGPILSLGVMDYLYDLRGRELESQLLQSYQAINKKESTLRAVKEDYRKAKTAADSLGIVSEKKTTSLDSVSQIAGRLEAKAVNADTMVYNARQIARNLEERTQRAERERQLLVNAISRPFLVYNIQDVDLSYEDTRQNNRPVAVYSFKSDVHTDDSRELARRINFRDTFGEKYPGLEGIIKKKGEGKITKIRVEEKDAGVYGVRVHYDDETSLFFEYKHPRLINTGGQTR